jgi:hypothetical protein
MNDLFRFLMLRPANVTPPADVKILTPSFVDKGATLEGARGAARSYVDKKAVLLSTDGLAFVSTALAVNAKVGSGSIPAKEVSAIIQKETGSTVAKVVADPRFAADEARLSDSLVAMKLLSDSSGGDAPGLAELAQGYDVIRQVASGRDPISMRVLSLPDFAATVRAPSPRQPSSGSNSPALPPARESRDSVEALKKLDAAIATLGTLPASGFHAVTTNDEQRAQLTRLDTRLASLEKQGNAPQEISALIAPPSSVTRPWTLSKNAISFISPAVQSTLNDAGVDLHAQSLPVILELLHTQRAEQLMLVEKATMPDQQLIHKIGNSFALVASNDYVGSPATSLPTGHGSVRPIGIGDLLLVKQHVLRYEGGDLAHVENVLKSEHLSRETRRLERTETTILRETETTKEEQRDTQTTDRFSLKRETSDTIKTDASFKAGISVDAKYGPFVEVKANADFATSTSSESSTKQASEFSKDVVARSASKLVERVLERRSVTTISEFEEKYSHGFDNTLGAGHISGYYQWIDKVMQAQVYNYGKRLLFDVTVPEPGTNFILAQTNAKDQGQSLVKPTTPSGPRSTKCQALNQRRLQ